MGKFTAYKVELASLRDGHYEREFEIGTEFFKNMENTDVLGADVHVHLNLVKKNDMYDCRFHLQGSMQIQCDRCLEPMDHDVDTDYHVVVKYGDNYDDGADNLLVIPYSNTYLNVAYILYDTLLLTIPLRHVHAPGKCNREMLEALRKHRGDRDPEAEEADVDVDMEDED
ncbi:MAG: DUF177 domain-containing protein [Candidatus Amulumruptor caecigallinarius]|nr:DUF177 domain-containing protein [Candidatus Amulumruptor caecigallinarius]